MGHNHGTGRRCGRTPSGTTIHPYSYCTMFSRHRLYKLAEKGIHPIPRWAAQNVSKSEFGTWNQVLPKSEVPEAPTSTVGRKSNRVIRKSRHTRKRDKQKWQRESL